MLTKLAVGVAAVASGTVWLRTRAPGISKLISLPGEDEAFLEKLEQSSFRLFLDGSHPRTGLVKNRVGLMPNNKSVLSSIAGTGFGLTALCIADQRGWLKPGQGLDRARQTLRFLRNDVAHQRGFFYHFMDWRNGERLYRCEASSIDTAILLCGALTCREYFKDDEIAQLASDLYDRVDWQWMCPDGRLLSHGWTPENGFLTWRWDTYCEHMMLYLLAIGARNKPIPPEAWEAWRRPEEEYAGIRWIDPGAPLFIHQYSHAWIDFRGRRDRHADYFENSTLATRAHQEFCAGLSREFPRYSDELWGFTASESPHGYVVWSGPPRKGPIDGSIVPSAAAGSLPFLKEDCMTCLRTMCEMYGKRIWHDHGLVDAFNPATGWVADECIAINTGITLLMAENARSGMVWSAFMKNAEIQRAMKLVGFSEA